MIYDNVHRPAHYNSGKIEVIDFLLDQRLSHCCATAVKYISRAGKKDPAKHIEDISKAIWYLNREVQRLIAEKAAPVDPTTHQANCMTT